MRSNSRKLVLVHLKMVDYGSCCTRLTCKLVTVGFLESLKHHSFSGSWIVSEMILNGVTISLHTFKFLWDGSHRSDFALEYALSVIITLVVRFAERLFLIWRYQLADCTPVFLAISLLKRFMAL